MTPVNRRGILWAFLICGGISLIIWFRTQKYESFSWIKPFQVSYIVTQVNRDTNRNTEKLVSQITNLVSNLSGTYAVLVCRLDDQTWYGINEELQMPAASLMKVPIMAAALKNLKLEDEYTLNNGDKQSGSGSIEFMDQGTVLTIKDLVTGMGKKSDNTATNVLSQKVGAEAILKIISDWNMNKTNYEQNTTTAYDVGEMWKQVYKLPQMWDFLQDSIYEDRITLGLPEGTKFVHKVGTDDGVWSDGGIVFAIEPYILAILSKDSKREEAEKIVPEITKIIWEYEAKIASPSPQLSEQTIAR